MCSQFERSWAMQESRAQRDISVSKQRPTQSRSVGLSISDAVDAHRFRPLEADCPSCWSRKTCKPHALAQWRGRFAVGQNPNPSLAVECQLSPTADMPPHWLWAAECPSSGLMQCSDLLALARNSRIH